MENQAILGPLNLEDALAGELAGIFGTSPDMKPFVFAASDTRVFDPAKAKIAKPKTKEAAAALLDMDDANEIRREMEKNKGSLRKPSDPD